MMKFISGELKIYTHIAIALFATSLLIIATVFSEKKTTASNLQGSASRAPTSLANLTATPSPKSSPSLTQQASKYPIHKRIYATMFWVGEKATEDNDYIPNTSSTWDKDWLTHFGGIDNPYNREGFYPKGFVPRENPFYFALPYDDLAENERKDTAQQIPWYTSSVEDGQSLLKNRWIKLFSKDSMCYAQWEDVGPFETDDFGYVFLGNRPKVKRSGIDLSPAVRTCLKMATNDYVSWQFVDEVDVPLGPWKKIVTQSKSTWQ